MNGKFMKRLGVALTATLLLGGLGGAAENFGLLPALISAGTDLGGGASTVALDDFCRAHGLTLGSEPGAPRLELHGPSLRLVLAPGLKFVAINGRISPLGLAPAYYDGRLRLPRELERLLGSDSGGGGGGPVSGVVILDPGHGGEDHGAVAGGIREKDLVLDVARRAAEELRRRGATVSLTRQNDRFIPLYRRAEIANRQPGALFVAIHANSGGANRSASGIETFVLGGVSESSRLSRAAGKYDLRAPDGGTLGPGAEAQELVRRSSAAKLQSAGLATCVQKSLVRTAGEADRGVRQKNLAVLRENYFGPAILTEIGFLTNPNTAAKLRDSGYRDRLAKALADGIAAYLAR